MQKDAIQTSDAPQAIGVYSQGMKAGALAFLSGQIPIDPKTGELVQGDFSKHVEQVFENLRAVAEAGGGSLSAIVKLEIFLTDLSHFAVVNEICARYFDEPYPARAVVEVSGLPKGAQIEACAVMMVS